MNQSCKHNERKYLCSMSQTARCLITPQKDGKNDHFMSIISVNTSTVRSVRSPAVVNFGDAPSPLCKFSSYKFVQILCVKRFAERSIKGLLVVKTVKIF